MRLIPLIDLLLLISVLALALLVPVIIPVDYIFKVAYLPYPNTFHISNSGSTLSIQHKPAKHLAELVN